MFPAGRLTEPGDSPSSTVALRRCGNCSGTRHNARTCKKDTEENSELELSSICTELWVDSDEIEEW
jgi:predicted metal-binding protein